MELIFGKNALRCSTKVSSFGFVFLYIFCAEMRLRSHAQSPYISVKRHQHHQTHTHKHRLKDKCKTNLLNPTKPVWSQERELHWIFHSISLSCFKRWRSGKLHWLINRMALSMTMIWNVNDLMDLFDQMKVILPSHVAQGEIKAHPSVSKCF